MEKPGSGTFLAAMNPVGIDFETIPQNGSKKTGVFEATQENCHTHLLFYCESLMLICPIDSSRTKATHAS